MVAELEKAMKEARASLDTKPATMTAEEKAKAETDLRTMEEDAAKAAGAAEDAVKADGDQTEAAVKAALGL